MIRKTGVLLILLILSILISVSCTKKEKQDNSERERLEYLSKIESNIEKKENAVAFSIDEFYKDNVYKKYVIRTYEIQKLKKQNKAILLPTYGNFEDIVKKDNEFIIKLGKNLLNLDSKESLIITTTKSKLIEKLNKIDDQVFLKVLIKKIDFDENGRHVEFELIDLIDLDKNLE